MNRGRFGLGRRGGWRSFLQLRRIASSTIAPISTLAGAASTGSSTVGVVLIAIGAITAASTGSGVDAGVTRKIGVLAGSTSGVAIDAATLVGRRILSLGTSGRSDASAILIDEGALAMASRGQSSVVASSIGVRRLAAATQGVGTSGGALVETGALRAATSGAGSTSIDLRRIGAFGPIASSGSSALQDDLQAAGTDVVPPAAPRPISGDVSLLSSVSRGRPSSNSRVQWAITRWVELGPATTTGSSDLHGTIVAVREVQVVPSSHARVAAPVSLVAVRADTPNAAAATQLVDSARHAHDRALAIALLLAANS